MITTQVHTVPSGPVFLDALRKAGAFAKPDLLRKAFKHLCKDLAQGDAALEADLEAKLEDCLKEYEEAGKLMAASPGIHKMLTP